MPTLVELRDQAAADIETFLPGSDARTRRTVTGVLGHAIAGAAQGLHANIQARERNFLPDDRAEAEGVERWATLLGYWYLDANAAAGPLTVTGSVGAVLSAGTRLQYSDGTEYATTVDLTLTGTTGTVPVEAQVFGAAGNLPVGAKLTLLSPVVGISSTLTVAGSGLTGGADQESLDALRARVLSRLRQPPMGGSAADYETWALEGHAAVTRAWVSPLEQGANTVVVRVVTDNEADLIPTAPVLDTVLAYINVKRPVTAEVFVVPPIAVPLNFEIQLTPDTAALRALVASALQDLLRREAEPGGTILRTHIAEAISTTVGETDHVLQSPVANVVHAAGEMAVFGSITWL
ncbi:baseplate J/gp47 family protein [Pseudomonas sp. 8Z]|uniref:baseplate J/gp47 family protein n=1 Tax=Pseudomonas sp. 8Z TaxID=2653166 RepID=UPI001C49C88F|nr:baseplate J/gp47 family protein [Pseudomonas sp. 8Z]